MVVAFRRPVLKSFCYDGTSSLAKTLMSRSRCFCFPLKTYTHGTTSPFPAADRHLLPSTLQVILLPLLATTASKPLAKGGLYSRESAYSKISPLPSLGHVYCKKRGGLFSGGYGNNNNGILEMCLMYLIKAHHFSYPVVVTYCRNWLLSAAHC